MSDPYEGLGREDYIIRFTGKLMPKGWRPTSWGEFGPRAFERDDCQYLVRTGLVGSATTERWLIVSKKSGRALRNERGGVRHFRSPGEAAKQADGKTSATIPLTVVKTVQAIQTLTPGERPPDVRN